MGPENKIQIDLNEYIKEKSSETPGIKLVSIEGQAYFQIKNFDPRNGKRLAPQLLPLASEGIAEVIAAIEKDLANHKVLLADVQAAEAK